MGGLGGELYSALRHSEGIRRRRRRWRMKRALKHLPEWVKVAEEKLGQGERGKTSTAPLADDMERNSVDYKKEEIISSYLFRKSRQRTHW